MTWLSGTHACLLFLTGSPSWPHQVHVRLHTFFQWPKMVTWPYHISTGKPQLLDTTDASRVPGGWRWPWCCWQQQLQRLAKLALPSYFAWLFGRLATRHILPSLYAASQNQRQYVTHLDSGSYNHPDDWSQNWGWGSLWVLNWRIKWFSFWRKRSQGKCKWHGQWSPFPIFCVWTSKCSHVDKLREQHWDHLLMLTTTSGPLSLGCVFHVVSQVLHKSDVSS